MNRLIGLVRVVIAAVALTVGVIFTARAGTVEDAAAQAVIHMNEDITWSFTTVVLCFLGWLLHWLMGWYESWRQQRVSLLDNILQNIPAFVISVVSTIAMYLIGPGVVAGIGLDLSLLPPQSAATLAKLGAFLGGYMADSLVGKIASMARKVAP